ncbi:helix-turn-helix transcriptional regulator [Streptomyces capparidis]
MSYRERPSAVLPGAVVWTRVADGGEGRILPDGCTDLVWNDDGGLLVAGPDTRAHLASAPPGSVWTGLRFAPGTGPAVLGVPAHELRDTRVRAHELWTGRAGERLAERLAPAPRPGRVLEEFAAARLREAGGALADPVAPAVVAALRRGAAVGAVARALGLSERQLHRRCLPAFGYGPKTLARVLRLRRALELARSGRAPLAEVAALTGYADQAHLTREVRALTGVTPRTLLGR